MSIGNQNPGASARGAVEFWEIVGLVALAPIAIFAGYIALMSVLGLIVGVGVAIKKWRDK